MSSNGEEDLLASEPTYVMSPQTRASIIALMRHCKTSSNVLDEFNSGRWKRHADQLTCWACKKADPYANAQDGATENQWAEMCKFYEATVHSGGIVNACIVMAEQWKEMQRKDRKYKSTLSNFSYRKSSSIKRESQHEHNNNDDDSEGSEEDMFTAIKIFFHMNFHITAPTLMAKKHLSEIDLLITQMLAKQTHLSSGKICPESIKTLNILMGMRKGLQNDVHNHGISGAKKIIQKQSRKQPHSSLRKMRPPPS